MQKKHTDANPLPPEHQDALARLERTLEPMFEHGYQVLQATIQLYQNDYRSERLGNAEQLDAEILELNALMQDDPDMSIEEAIQHSQASYRRIARSK